MNWFSDRKRQKSLVFLLLIFGLITFAYARRETFLQQAKKLIKQNLEKSFPCDLSIGKIKAGLFYGVVLEDLEIGFPQEGRCGPAFNIKIDRAFVDYNLWRNVFTTRGALLNKSNGRGELVFALQGGRIYFADSRPLLKNLQGQVVLSQKGLIFEDIEAAFKEGLPNVLKLYGEFSENRLTLSANLEPSKVGNFDVLTNLVLTLDKKVNLHDKTQKICGTLKTYGSVLNKRPFPEVNSSFEIQDAKLRLLTFTLGDSYDLRGILSLSRPFDVDLSLNFYQAAPSELISRFAWAAQGEPGFAEQPHFSGLINGLIKIAGDIKRPRVEGYLEAREGRIGDLSFVSADINIKGRYPRIMIVDSRICREEDFFIVEGEMDFANLERQDFLDIRLKSDKGMLWQGWDITRRPENQVHISKSIADDLKVTFDSFMEDANEGFEGNYTNELGLEYKIFGDKLLKLRLRKAEGILGLERKIKF
ncbi:MAG: hypothetical protein ISS24_01670 [Candidatus Omnitrophica bacterium]|nr:hypothetical protein [Candidatus Omnitrophota bacterium]